MAQQAGGKHDILERGDIYFFYRPKVDTKQAKGVRDVERFYIVLSPEGKKVYRLIIVGQKAMPQVERHERNWGFVQKVAWNPDELKGELEGGTYETKTRGERELKPARPAGEGVYAIVRHDGHTHLAYSLELPDEPDKVQRDLRIDPEGSYIVSIKNPEKGAPKGVGLREQEKVALPKRLQEVFLNRRFADADPPDFLDYEGTELLLIGASEDPRKELDIRLKAEHEKEPTADIFTDLRLDRKEHPLKPLFEGKWE
jgi:hypothetical protein